MSKVFNGSRAKLGIYDPVTGLTNIVGIFTNVTWGWNYDTQSAPILGRDTVAEISYTGVQEIAVTATGWRVIGADPHKVAGLPPLEQLHTAPYIEMVILDRQAEIEGTGEPRVTKLKNVRCTGYSTGVSAKQQAEVTCSYVGILVSTETTTNAEHPSATDLPG